MLPFVKELLVGFRVGGKETDTERRTCSLFRARSIGNSRGESTRGTHSILRVNIPQIRVGDYCEFFLPFHEITW